MEKVDIAQQLKHKIISLWLHLWLKRIARKYPDFFMNMMADVCYDDKSKEIMCLRYKKELKFKQIPKMVNLEERQVYKIHQKVIKKLITI